MNIHNFFYLYAYKGMGQRLEKFTKQDFLDKAITVHGNKYDYTLVDFIDYNKTPVKIICSEHGEFLQLPSNHCVKKCGCPICKGTNHSKQRRLSNDDIINKIQGQFGTNSLVLNVEEYKNTNSKLQIKCLKHDMIFSQYAKHLFSGVYGCKKCGLKKTKNEKIIEEYLKSKNIKYEPQKKFEDLKYITYLHFDFYLPEYNMSIEYDGEQHYKAYKLFGGEEGLKLIQLRDELKNSYCISNGIRLLRIKYNENTLEILKEYFI